MKRSIKKYILTQKDLLTYNIKQNQTPTTAEEERHKHKTNTNLVSPVRNTALAKTLKNSCKFHSKGKGPDRPL